jgi:hypothetical protein
MTIEQVNITRSEAYKLIHDRLNAYRLNKMSNEELIDIIESIGIGNNINLPYYGTEFTIKENEHKKETK